MHLPLTFRVVDREGLALAIGSLANEEQRTGVVLDVAEVRIPPKGAAVGKFGLQQGATLPDFIVVRDEDLSDTYAWVSAYFNALTPITQWCRVWRQSEFGRLDLASDIGLPKRLGPWIGAIIGECLVQANYALNLKAIPGSAAMATATFAAARGSAVWGDLLELEDLSRRYDDLHQRYRNHHRALSGRDLLPLWFVLSDNPNAGRSHVSQRAMSRVAELLAEVVARGIDGLKDVARLAAEEFSLSELFDCAQGGQAQRVEAVDRLAGRLLAGPASPVRDAILGFGASLVEPGVAALPDLLKRYTDRMPMAPLWLGAFAGAWAPGKVINDNQGLGRLILKALEASPDLAERPVADIAYDELSRWLGPAGARRPTIRAMSARTLNIEIIPGVIAPFSVANEAQVEPVPSRPATERRSTASEPPRNDMNTIMRSLENLAGRLARLEAGASGESGTLPGLDVPDTKSKRRGKTNR